MIRFAIFVDGSNLFGVMKNMSLQVDDYEAFYAHIFRRAVEAWRETVEPSNAIPTQLRRVYWYLVGGMDTWDLTDARTLDYLRRRFEREPEIRKAYMADMGPRLKGEPQEKVAQAAFQEWIGHCREWYDRKRSILARMRNFHYAVRAETDFIDLKEVGRWKVDMVHHSLTEKGIDTSLAVDMVALADNYDVAIIVSGDADNIPSIEYLKTRNKHVAAVEFFSGYPPERRGRNFSSDLKLIADFVVPVYEMELVKEGVAKKAEASDEDDAP